MWYLSQICFSRKGSILLWTTWYPPIQCGQDRILVYKLAYMTTSTRDRDTLLRLVNDIHLAFARLFNHQASDRGLTRAHWRVIAGLYRKNGLTQTELATTIAMARSPLGKIIDRLEESGLVERRPDPEDRRVKRLHLTEAAMPLISPAQRLVTDLENTATAGLSDSQAEELISALVSVRKALDAEMTHQTIQWDE